MDVTNTETHTTSEPSVDLVGGQFAVLESDPGVFTSLLRKLGVRGLEVTEIFDIDDLQAGKRVEPRGLIFCYPCADDEDASNVHDKEVDEVDDDPDPDAKDVWFAHQLCNDACGTQAILNIALNLREVTYDTQLTYFKRDTEKMDPVMKGLALTNCAFIREAHNALARPADIRAAAHAAASSTLEYMKKEQKKKARNGSSPPPAKRRKFNLTMPRRPRVTEDEPAGVDTYHFIGYVPIDGKVWELDGLRKSGPLEVGEVITSSDPETPSLGWLEIVRPALLRRMRRLQENDHIRYNLLAVVEDQYEKVSDELELLKRQRHKLEGRLGIAFPNGWREKVDQDVLDASAQAFCTSNIPSGDPGPTFSIDFASRRMKVDIDAIDMDECKLQQAWVKCVRDAQAVKALVEEEIRKSQRANMDHKSRTFDYEPFIQTFIRTMQAEGSLQPILSPRAAAQPSNGAKKGKSKRQ